MTHTHTHPMRTLDRLHVSCSLCKVLKAESLVSVCGYESDICVFNTWSVRDTKWGKLQIPAETNENGFDISQTVLKTMTWKNLQHVSQHDVSLCCFLWLLVSCSVSSCCLFSWCGAADQKTPWGQNTCILTDMLQTCYMCVTYVLCMFHTCSIHATCVRVP